MSERMGIENFPLIVKEIEEWVNEYEMKHDLGD